MAKLKWENAFSLIEPQINAEGIHLWSFDPSFALDVRFYVYDKRHHIRLNRHDYFEIFYLYAGELVCRIQDREFSMRSGDLAIINSTQYHTMQFPERRKTAGQVRAAALYFLPQLIRGADAAGEGVEYLVPFLMQDSDFPHIIARRAGIPAQILEFIRLIQKELPANTTRARLNARTWLKMILLLLVNHYADHPGTTETFQRKQQAIEQLGPLFAFLEKHYQEPVSIGTAAQVVNMSESHFMRFFKQVTGQSFISYLNHFRIARAQHLLVTTNLSVAEISQAVGFSDQSYFGLIFRRLVQLPPLQYRQQGQFR